MKYLHPGGIIFLFKILMFLFLISVMHVYSGCIHFHLLSIIISRPLLSPETYQLMSLIRDFSPSGLSSSLLHGNSEGTHCTKIVCSLTINMNTWITLFSFIFFELSYITILCKKKICEVCFTDIKQCSLLTLTFMICAWHCLFQASVARFIWEKTFFLCGIQCLEISESSCITPLYFSYILWCLI